MRWAAVAGALLGLTTVVATGDSADAHSGEAVFEVLESSADADLVVHVRTRVRYSGDDEPAERAFLQATARSSDDRALPPVDLERGTDGVYSGDVAVDEPGRWTIEITSAFPPGQTSFDVDVDVGRPGRADQRGPILMAGVTAAIAVAIVIGWQRRARRRA